MLIPAGGCFSAIRISSGYRTTSTRRILCIHTPAVVSVIVEVTRQLVRRAIRFV
jgi:hypothetical protein